MSRLARSAAALAGYRAASDALDNLPLSVTPEQLEAVIVRLEEGARAVRAAWAEDMAHDPRSVRNILEAQPSWCVDQVASLLGDPTRGLDVAS